MSRNSIQESVWISDKQEGFLLVVIENRSDAGVHFSVNNKQLTTKEYYPHNPSLLHTISDLCMLSYLHEPAILHTLKQRYLQQNIYTWSGLVLIAINPFKSLPIYGHNMISQYQHTQDNLDPHIFMIAKASYNGLSLQNQSIIVSGESGAGKTQSAKYLMSYITGQNSAQLSDIESAVLATNPLTESFGNAKTVRNDNSSRFGKYLEMLFIKENDQYIIIGAKMSTFLLERSRIVYQPPNERNYHIFYQLIKGCALAERKQLYLTSVQDYVYVKQCATIDNVDDQAEFNLTQKAFSEIGISVAMQWKVFQVLAGILHLGNIKFIPIIKNELPTDEYQVDLTHNHSKYACELLGLDHDVFIKHLLLKVIHLRSEKIESPLSQKEAQVLRDAVGKYIYTWLFDWLIIQINNALLPNKTASQSFIGILDIFGFEHFKTNSFEQFCINYANEKLQQEFCQHVFKVEQQRYVEEGIDWTFIAFQDNQQCIDLIENRVGILSLLDEEVRLPGGNDASFINKCISNCASNPKFGKPKFGMESFVVKHYAYDVEYHMEGFIDKNKDSIPDEMALILLKSSNELLIEMLPTQQKGKSTLGNTFKNSLIDLLKTISSTDVSYVRCIKPNSSKTAFHFEPVMVLQQLRACGVLETIRISSAGYPGRMAYNDFENRYYFLVPFKYRSLSNKDLVLKILETILNDPKRESVHQQLFQLGKTKLFFRAGELAYLERQRDRKLRHSAILIQKNIKMAIYKRKYLKKQIAAIKIQSVMRRYLAIKHVHQIRLNKAALMIQKWIKMYIYRTKFKIQRQSIITIQSLFRGYRLRIRFANKKKHYAALKIQRVWRGHCSRKTTSATLRKVIIIQSLFRRKQAYKTLKLLKVEAKSVNHLKDVSYKLENKVVQLTQLNQSKDQTIKELHDKLNSMDHQNQVLRSKPTNKASEKMQEKSATKRVLEMEQKCKLLTQSCAEYLSKLSLIENENSSLKKQNEKLSKDNYFLEQQLQTQIDKLTNINVLEQQVQKLKIEIHKMNDLEQAETPTTPEDKGQVLTHQLFDQKVNVEELSQLQQKQLKDVLLNPMLEQEMIKYFIHHSLPHVEGTSSSLLRKQALYPAHVLAVFLIKKWQLKLPIKSFTHILKLIDEKLDSDVYKLIGYWTGAVYELLCIIKSVKIEKNRSLASVDLSEHGKEMLRVQNEVEKLFNKGFIKEDGGFFQRLGYAAEKHSVEDLLDQLTEHIQQLRQYAMDDTIVAQLFGELIRLLGIEAFNHLLMRRSFSTWKRGMQIQYNVSRVVEWARKNKVEQAGDHFEKIMECAKLMQLSKAIPTNHELFVEDLCEVCHDLNASQVQKLLTVYMASEFDSPIPNKLIQLLGHRVKDTDTLLLEVPIETDYTWFEKPDYRKIKAIFKYLPQDIENEVPLTLMMFKYT